MKLPNRISFNTLEIRQNIIRQRKILILSLFVFPVLGYFFKPHESKELLILFLLLFFGMVLLNILFQAFVKRYRITGSLNIEETKTIINNKNIALSDIERITVYYSGVKGDMYPLAGFGIGIFGFNDGANNKIQIIKKDKTSINTNFLIETKEKYTILKRYFQFYREKGIEINICIINPTPV
ncbi:MAG: hypothetical protein IPM71_15100 [Bacteroidota bacterium]|nr:MAG: hypothetical protein IPM71_15100 [Bacteroidota bacterium]